MTQLVAFYVRSIEPLARFAAKSRQRTTVALRAARIGVTPEGYLALSYAAAGAAAVLGALIAYLALRGDASVSGGLKFALSLSGALVGSSLARLGFLAFPRIVASSRARQIDAEFPSVVMLCYALAKGGVDAMSIFRAVAQEKEAYGEISREFQLVIRDMEWMGQDMNAALQSVAATTPSMTLKLFFEGLVTMLNSGADPRDYFKRQALQQLANAQTAMEREVDQAGLLAETYVSGLLVLPLLLIVVLSILSALQNMGSQYITMIVFGVMPLGTLAYLVVVDMLLPPEALTLPKRRADGVEDFGMATTRADDPRVLAGVWPRLAELRDEIAAGHRRGGVEAVRAARLRRVLFLEWGRRSVVVAWREFSRRCLQEPMRGFYAGGPVGLIAFGVGWGVIRSAALEPAANAVAISGLCVASALVASFPSIAFHEVRVRLARRVDADLPETLSKLAGFNERGVGLLRSFQILGRTARGPLAGQMRALDRDVSWSANLRAALSRLRARVATRRVVKVGILLERGAAATGNLKEALEISAQESASSEHQRARKTQAMVTYMIVIYVVFAVFLYVLYTVANLFYGSEGLSSLAKGSVSGVSPGLSAKDEAGILYLNAVVIQGACCGLVAGKLGEGHVLSGIKHAILLAGLAWGVFALGVLS